MSNDVIAKIFKHKDFGKVEVIKLNDEILFNANDVARVLDIKEVRSVIRDWDERYKRILTNSNVHSMHIRKLANRGETFLTEAGLYKLIFKSRKPEAEKFQDWVFTEVLPDIRQYGLYAKDELINKIIEDPDFGIELLTKYKEEKQRRIEAEKTNAILMHTKKLYTTTEIAKELGLKSAYQLNKILEKLNIQYKMNNTWVLYSDYADLGYEHIKQEVLDNGHVIYHRKWTQRGREFILKLLKNLNLEEILNNDSTVKE